MPNPTEITGTEEKIPDVVLEIIREMIVGRETIKKIMRYTGLTSEKLDRACALIGVNLPFLVTKEEENARAADRSRRMFQTDMASDLATIKDIGRREGRVEGRAERDFEFTLKLLKRNRPIEEIMEYTGLTHDEIERLGNPLFQPNPEWDLAVAKGRIEGMRDGRNEGRREGYADGENTGRFGRNIEIARSMMADGEPIEKIMQYTSLSRSNIEEFVKHLA